MNNRIRYNADEHQRHTFYQTPKFLFTGEFKSLNNDARMTYSLLRDRHDLSLKNHWVDEKNDIYLIFSRDEICEALGISKPTVIKAMNDLKKHNLIQEERFGQGKPNRIYLLTINTSTLTYDKPVNPVNIEKSNSFTSRSKESLPQEVKNFYPNDTDLKDIDFNETEGEKRAAPHMHSL